MNKELEAYLGRLKEIYKELERSTWNGIRGIQQIDSGVPGPIVGITACTHGSEPSGLAAIEHLLRAVDVGKKLQKGALFLVVNNLEAAGEYFNDFDRPESERKNRRFLDHNMNRLPLDLRTNRYEKDESREILRARELCRVWEEFTVGFDIHSTIGDIAPMIITGQGCFHRDLVRGFPIVKVLNNIDQVQIGAPVFGFMGKQGARIPVFEIEAGTHTSVESFSRASTCAEALLTNLGMLSGVTSAAVDAYEVYEMYDTLIFPNGTFELSRYFQDFEEIHEGETLARGRGTRIVSQAKSHAVFCSDKMKPEHIGEEVMYLSRPMQLVKA